MEEEYLIMCSTCELDKSLEEFYKNARNTARYCRAYRCIECSLKANKEHAKLGKRANKKKRERDEDFWDINNSAIYC